MVTTHHEASHQIFRDQPTLLAPISPLLLAIEAQGRYDRDKPLAWAWYLSFLKSKHRCPALLLVISDLLEAGLEDTQARDHWRNLMLKNGTFFPGRGMLTEEKFLEGKAEGLAEGEARERARVVLFTLDHRGLTIPDDIRARVTACTDLDTLATWLERAFTIAAPEDLFA